VIFETIVSQRNWEVDAATSSCNPFFNTLATKSVTHWQIPVMLVADPFLVGRRIEGFTWRQLHQCWFSARSVAWMVIGKP
jgi:hypothetical protein